MTKKERKKYELLPPKIAESDTVSLGHGLCGSVGSIYNKDTSQNILYASLIALTMIDPATGWFEIVKATNNSATSTQDLFNKSCLARYPQPQFIVFDNGGEFKREFKQMCDNYGIKAKPNTSHNHACTSKYNHWASTQSCQWNAQIIWLEKHGDLHS
jgi:hypothetical protein